MERKTKTQQGATLGHLSIANITTGNPGSVIVPDSTIAVKLLCLYGVKMRTSIL